jgi:hypothetical protein
MNASFLLTSEVTRWVSRSPFMRTGDALVLINPSFMRITASDLYSNRWLLHILPTWVK